MQSDADRLRDYYDHLLGGLLAGYVYGSERIQAALRFVLAWTPPDAQRILEAGCGIGESTDALKRHRPAAFVLGIDSHERLLERARRLFGDGDAVFTCADILTCTPEGPPFDVIVLMDVYEHIPLASRPRLHAVLNGLLAPFGRLLLTTPSISHQHYLRDDTPGGLQPIDEDVSRADFERLAADIGGTLAHYLEVSVWRSRDYVHAVVARDRDARATPGPAAAIDRRAREEHVERRLAVRVSREGALLPVRDGANVCIVQPNCDAYSERLIRDQLERLPANVTMLCDGWFPRRRWNGDRVLALPFAAARRVALKTIGVLPELPQRIATRGLASYLRRHAIDVVLAQYGPTGAAIADACTSAGVPLVVQFHGFDAHHRPTLAAHHDAYQRLFRSAAAVVAVSTKMAGQLIALGAPPGKVRHVAGGVDCARFEPGDPGAAPPMFVSVARFVDKKAPHVTLTAFSRVLVACPEATLVMLGDGVLLEPSRALAASLGITASVEFRGAVSAFAVRAALRSARAFVLHSIETPEGDSEGTPIAVLEAAASGLPVIATRHAGIADAVIDGETGYLVEERDVEAMAARMIELAGNPALAASLGRQARVHIEAHFSIEQNITGLWAVLETAVRPRH